MAFNKVLLLVMFKGSPQNYTSITGDDVTLHLVFLIPRSCTMNSNLKVYWEPSRYSNIAEPKPFYLSNYYSIINTQVRWLPNAWMLWTITTYFCFKLFICVAESQLYTYLLALLLHTHKYIYIYIYIYILYGFHRFRGLLIHSFVTP